jgi:hypothetical protein
MRGCGVAATETVGAVRAGVLEGAQPAINVAMSERMKTRYFMRNQYFEFSDYIKPATNCAN